MLTYRQFLVENETDFVQEVMKYAMRLGITQKDLQSNPAKIADAIYYFVTHVVKERCPEAEPILKRYDSKHNAWRDYCAYVYACPYSLEDKMGWLKEEGVTDTLFDILNYSGVRTMPVEIQEYIIQHRPDLINKIQGLDPELKAKYRHEDELGNTDL